MDGVRHAADERAFPHRGNDPRARRRCTPDCASGPSSALLSRLRFRDRRLGLTAQATRSIDSKERFAVDAEAYPRTARGWQAPIITETQPTGLPLGASRFPRQLPCIIP